MRRGPKAGQSGMLRSVNALKAQAVGKQKMRRFAMCGVQGFTEE